MFGEHFGAFFVRSPDPQTLAFLKQKRKARETPKKTRVLLFAEPLKSWKRKDKHTKTQGKSENEKSKENEKKQGNRRVRGIRTSTKKSFVPTSFCSRTTLRIERGEKTPTPKISALLRKRPVLLRANFVLTKDRKRPYYGHHRGKIHSEGSCSKAAGGP